MLTSFFFLKNDFLKKRKEVCIKTRSTLASLSLTGYGTMHIVVKWSILFKSGELFDDLRLQGVGGGMTALAYPIN